MFKVPVIPPNKKSRSSQPSARVIAKQIIKKENEKFAMANVIEPVKIQTRRISVCDREQNQSVVRVKNSAKKRRLWSPENQSSNGQHLKAFEMKSEKFDERNSSASLIANQFNRLVNPNFSTPTAAASPSNSNQVCTIYKYIIGKRLSIFPHDSI
jgi:hypothetical protein